MLRVSQTNRSIDWTSRSYFASRRRSSVDSPVSPGHPAAGAGAADAWATIAGVSAAERGAQVQRHDEAPQVPVVARGVAGGHVGERGGALGAGDVAERRGALHAGPQRHRLGRVGGVQGEIEARVEMLAAVLDAL